MVVFLGKESTIPFTSRNRFTSGVLFIYLLDAQCMKFMHSEEGGTP